MIWSWWRNCFKNSLRWACNVPWLQIAAIDYTIGCTWPLWKMLVLMLITICYNAIVMLLFVIACICKHLWWVIHIIGCFFKGSCLNWVPMPVGAIWCWNVLVCSWCVFPCHYCFDIDLQPVRCNNVYIK